MDPTWQKLYHAVRQVLKPRDVSERIEAGGVSAAVESVSGKIYVGVCVDKACSLGICAERNAIFSMITHGEDAVRRVIAMDRNTARPCRPVGPAGSLWHSSCRRITALWRLCWTARTKKSSPWEI